MFFTKLSEKTLIPFIISLALFMEALDATIINTAIPAMSRSLQVNPVDLKIALISYLLSLAIFIPISGWVADKFGIKRVFLIALSIFTVSSFWCGYTNNLIELVIARSLQGIGGSHMLPLGRLIIVRTFARHELINVMTRVVMVAALGMMLGPVLGGVITSNISWRWIFWINIPVGLLTIWLAYRSLPTSPPRTVPPLDKLGFVLLGTGLAGLVFGLSAFTETDMKLSVSLSILAVAILLLIANAWHSRHVENPIVNPNLFTSRTFSVSIAGNLMSRLGFGGVPFLLPLLLQISYGYTAQLSGLLLAPTAIGVLMVKPFSFILLRLFGYKKLLIINTFLVAVSLWSFSLININTPIYVIALLTLSFGFLISLQYSGMNSLGYAQLPPEYLSAATSVMSTAQQLSQSFGVAAAAILIGYFSGPHSGKFLLTPDIFHRVFIAMGFMTLLTTFIFSRLKSDDGEELIKEPVSA